MKLYETEISVSINKSVFESNYIHLVLSMAVWGYFSIVELYCCYRNDMAPKAYSIYTLALDQKSLLAFDIK